MEENALIAQFLALEMFGPHRKRKAIPGEWGAAE